MTSPLKGLNLNPLKEALVFFSLGWLAEIFCKMNEVSCHCKANTDGPCCQQYIMYAFQPKFRFCKNSFHSWQLHYSQEVL